jgi:hypothetical protein
MVGVRKDEKKSHRQYPNVIAEWVRLRRCHQFTTSTMSKQFQFKLVLLGMYSARHNTTISLTCIQVNLRLENLGEPIICLHWS